MGTYIDSVVWDDEWWLNLGWDARCLWWQLLSLKIPLSGIFILTPGKITDMKIPDGKNVEDLINELGDKVIYDPATKYLFIKNYCKRICGDTNEKQAKNISKTMSDIKNCEMIKKAFFEKYNSLLVDYPDLFTWYKNKKNRRIDTPIDRGMDIPPKTKDKRLIPKDKELIVWFDSEFYPLYLKKVGKEEAVKAIIKLNPDIALRVLMIERLKLLNEKDYKYREKKHISNPASWINQKRWNDEPVVQEKREPDLEDEKLAYWNSLPPEEQARRIKEQQEMNNHES